jgi:hypothetical protein
MSWLSLDDDRVRVVGLTTPEPGRVLVRLQSVADTPVAVRIRPAWPIQQSQHTSFLGEPLRTLPASTEEIAVTVDPFGVTAVLLTLGAPSGSTHVPC